MDNWFLSDTEIDQLGVQPTQEQIAAYAKEMEQACRKPPATAIVIEIDAQRTVQPADRMDATGQYQIPQKPQVRSAGDVYFPPIGQALRNRWIASREQHHAGRPPDEVYRSVFSVELEGQQICLLREEREGWIRCPLSLESRGNMEAWCKAMNRSGKVAGRYKPFRQRNWIKKLDVRSDGLDDLLGWELYMSLLVEQTFTGDTSTTIGCQTERIIESRQVRVVQNGHLLRPSRELKVTGKCPLYATNHATHMLYGDRWMSETLQDRPPHRADTLALMAAIFERPENLRRAQEEFIFSNSIATAGGVKP